MAYVVSFHGCDHKCGVSTISQSVAEKAASALSDKRVLLIHTEQGPGNDYSPMIGESLENIRPYLAENLINTDELIDKCKYKNNLYILGGASKPGSSGLYHPDMAEYLIQKVSKVFDFVICDTGSEIEHGMCLGALCSSEAVYQITTQSEIAIKRFEWQASLYDKLRLKIAKLIINKYNGKEINSKDIIAARLGFKNEDIVCVKRSSYGEMAEDEGKSILSFRERAFSKSIEELFSDIVKRSETSDV